MTTDRELLELAAKAAGYSVMGVGDGRYGGNVVFYMGQDQLYWNPLTDDGDAFRLAVKLRLDILLDRAAVQSPCVEVLANTGADIEPFAIETIEGNDPYAATRRAIVRAAAEIGRAMG